MITAGGKRWFRRGLSREALNRILAYQWTHDWRPDNTVPFTTVKPNGQQTEPSSAART